MTIDIIGDVAHNFEDLINQTAVKELLTQIIKSEGGSVSFDGNSFTYEDATGVHTIDFKSLVEDSETVTTLVKDASNNGKYVYTNEEDAVVTIDITADAIGNFQTIIENNAVENLLQRFIIDSNTLVKTEVDYVVLDIDTTIVVDAEAEDLTLTIPAASPANEGRIIAIRKIDESAHTLSFSQQIKASKTQSFASLNYPATLRIQSDGIDWYMID